MSVMVRKQIYLRKHQAAMLKRQARLRGVSEAELIREVLDRQVEYGARRPMRPDPAAWERAHKFMLALHAEGPIPSRSRQWTREELYEERLSRYARHPH